MLSNGKLITLRMLTRRMPGVKNIYLVTLAGHLVNIPGSTRLRCRLTCLNWWFPYTARRVLRVAWRCKRKERTDDWTGPPQSQIRNWAMVDDRPVEKPELVTAGKRGWQWRLINQENHTRYYANRPTDWTDQHERIDANRHTLSHVQTTSRTGFVCSHNEILIRL